MLSSATHLGQSHKALKKRSLSGTTKKLGITGGASSCRRRASPPPSGPSLEA